MNKTNHDAAVIAELELTIARLINSPRLSSVSERRLKDCQQRLAELKVLDCETKYFPTFAVLTMRRLHGKWEFEICNHITQKTLYFCTECYASSHLALQAGITYARSQGLDR